VTPRGGEHEVTVLVVREDDLSGADIRALLEIHLRGMHESSPPGWVFALDLSGLQTPDVTVWSAWHGAEIAGVGALKMLSTDHAEIKSMRVHPDFLRRGVGRAMLVHILSVARGRGVTRLSLETGVTAAFGPAIALYRAHGFVSGAAFADYPAGEFNQFFHLSL